VIPGLVKESAEVLDPVVIHVERSYRCAPAGGDAEDHREVGAPREVIAEAVLSWIVECDNMAAHCIERAGLVVFVRIAARARESEVFDLGRSARAPRDDVVHDE
jgi:hypothetical protein